MQIRLSVAAIAVGATLALSHTADASVTVGSPLMAPNAGGTCGADTFTNTALGTGTVAVPFDGAAVRWRLSLPTGGGSYTYNLRVLRPAGGSQYTGAGTGPPQTATATGVNTLTLASALRVRAGDLIGVDCLYGAPAPFSLNAPGSTFAYFGSPLADGSTKTDTESSGREELVNADVVGNPSVTNVAPASGPSAGGTTVTITGTHLTDITAVTFGGTTAAAVHVVSDSQVTATAPAHAGGPVDVQVINAAGTSPVVSGDAYSYVAPPPAPAPPGQPSHPTPTAGSATLKSSTVRISRSGQGQLILGCTAVGPCAGSYEIDATGAQATRRHTKRPKTAILARGPYAITASGSAKTSFRLSAQGRKLMRRHHGRLRTTLKLTPTTGSPTALSLSLKAA